MEIIKKNPTEFAYFRKVKKTIEQLGEEEVPKYLEKEEPSSFLKIAKEQGLELDYLMFLSFSTQESGLGNWLLSNGKM
ncbi:hypothetical protein [Salinibacillus xinjiangensis]|uniref:hypothetical protein n=1 Tax=Salinibacillus xinjiangensis TaxID=1229268 RepID=UPI00129B38EE|nr:hypothetical protein [Salinibacillus xinjiangensis]